MTNPTPTDWRALCAELVDALDTNDYYNEISDEMFYSGLLNRARTALAQPEPVPHQDKLDRLIAMDRDDPANTIN